MIFEICVCQYTTPTKESFGKILAIYSHAHGQTWARKLAIVTLLIYHAMWYSFDNFWSPEFSKSYEMGQNDCTIIGKHNNFHSYLAQKILNINIFTQNLSGV